VDTDVAGLIDAVFRDTARATCVIKAMPMIRKIIGKRTRIHESAVYPL